MGDARAGRFAAAPSPPICRAVDSGHRSGGTAARRRKEGIRNVAYASFRAPTDGCSTAKTRSGSVDHVIGQPAQPGPGDPRDRCSCGRRAGREEMNTWAQEFFGRPIIERLAEATRFHDEDLPRARAPSRRPSRASRGGAGFSASIVDRPSTSRTITRRSRKAGASWFSTCRKSRRPKKPRSGRDPRRARRASRPPGRYDQGVRARRADRGVLSADGNSRGARQAFRRLQHRAVGLHQQRFGCGGVGSEFVNPNIDAITMTYGYMRELRRPRATRCEHAGPRRDAARSGRAAWNRTSLWDPSRASQSG